MQIQGRCHCGNIAFALDGFPTPGAIPARACDCTFCQKHGAVWTAHPTARLRVTLAEPLHVSRYRFGTGTAQFLVCSTCGVVPVVLSDVEGQRYAVVNVHTFENVDASMLLPQPVSFGEEDAATRLARRQHHWIAQVEVIEGTS
jgi:hypothetical protein